MFQFVVRKPSAQELRSFTAAAAADNAMVALAVAYQLAGTTPDYVRSMPQGERVVLDDAIYTAMVAAHHERQSVLSRAASLQIDLSESDLASETGEIASLIMLRLAERHGGRHGLN